MRLKNPLSTKSVSFDARCGKIPSGTVYDSSLRGAHARYQKREILNEHFGPAGSHRQR